MLYTKACSRNPLSNHLAPTSKSAASLKLFVNHLLLNLNAQREQNEEKMSSHSNQGKVIL
jgi:hypothetical protein